MILREVLLRPTERLTTLMLANATADQLPASSSQASLAPGPDRRPVC